MKKAHESINPGEILLTESLEPLGVDDRFWINVQIDHDLEVARDLYAEAVAKVTTLVAS